MTDTTTAPWTRKAEWGHWGITFSWVRRPNGFHPEYRIAATLGFPIGTRGPCDMNKRDEYKAAIAAWIEKGELPADAFKSRSGPPEGAL